MQVLVIGAGVIGLAVARTAALAGHDVTVAESTGGIANGVSSRNSEVIHAGLYYPTGTLRAIHCVRGRRMLYEFCVSLGVAQSPNKPQMGQLYCRRPFGKRQGALYCKDAVSKRESEPPA